jgi:hypothetical protein
MQTERIKPIAAYIMTDSEITLSWCVFACVLAIFWLAWQNGKMARRLIELEE